MGTRPFPNTIVWFFLAYLLLSIILVGWLLWPFMSTIVIAAVVGGIFHPLYRRLQRRVRPVAASLITCLLVFIVLFVPIALMVGVISREALGLYQMGRSAMFSDQVSDLLAGSQVLERLNHYLARVNLQASADQVNNALAQVGKVMGLFLYQQASSIASNILSFVVYFALMLIIVFYLLIDGGRLVDFLVDLSPLTRTQNEHLIQKFKDMIGAVLLGNGVGGLIQGVVGGALFALFSFKSPILWGVIMGLLAFLPIVGIGMVMMPAGLWLLLKGNVAGGLFIIGCYSAVSWGVEYLLKPRMVGKRVQMHTLLVFLAIIGGLKLFGLLGIIYGPLVITAFLTLMEIYRGSYQQLLTRHRDEVSP